MLDGIQSESVRQRLNTTNAKSRFEMAVTGRVRRGLVSLVVMMFNRRRFSEHGYTRWTR